MHARASSTELALSTQVTNTCRREEDGEAELLVVSMLVDTGAPSAQAHCSASARPPAQPRPSISAGAAGSTAAPCAAARLVSAHAASTAPSAASAVCWLPRSADVAQAFGRTAPVLPGVSSVVLPHCLGSCAGRQVMCKGRCVTGLGAPLSAAAPLQRLQPRHMVKQHLRQARPVNAGQPVAGARRRTGRKKRTHPGRAAS